MLLVDSGTLSKKVKGLATMVLRVKYELPSLSGDRQGDGDTAQLTENLSGMCRDLDSIPHYCMKQDIVMYCVLRNCTQKDLTFRIIFGYIASLSQPRLRKTLDQKTKEAKSY